MLISFLTLYLLLNYIIVKLKPKIIINEIFWLLTSWIFILGLYFTSGISYYYYLQETTILYIILVLCIYIFARNLGYKIIFKKSVTKMTNMYGVDKKIDTRPYFYLALLGLILRAYDLIHLNSLTFGVKTELNSSIIGIIGSFFTPLGIVIWLYELVWALRHQTQPPMRAFISIGIYILPVIIISGRINILNLLVASVIATIYTLKTSKSKEDETIVIRKRSKFKKLVKPLFLFAMLGFIYYTMFLAENRYGSNLVGMFEYASQSKISSETIDIVSKFEGLGDVLLNLLHYYTHQLSTIEIIFSYYDGPYLLGMHQLHYLSRRLPDFLELNSFLADDSFANTAYSLGAYGFHSAWKTAIGSFIFDFGRIGTVFFVIILGFMVGQKRKKFIASKSAYETVFQILICVGSFFTIHYSPFYETSWAYALYWMFIISFVNKLRVNL